MAISRASKEGKAGGSEEGWPVGAKGMSSRTESPPPPAASHMPCPVFCLHRGEASPQATCFWF